ncbi:kinase-like protein [Pilatotrama ljubarskyi]|nr:kinase-like protein [Pilatotrama ljubarskyi]
MLPGAVVPGEREYIPSFSVCGIWQTTHFIGQGSTGEVIHAFNALDGTEVVVKMQPVPLAAPEPSKPLSIEYEAAMYRLIPDDTEGFPVVHWSGIDGNHWVLVLDKLGPTLESLRRFCRGKFSLKTICMLADQMLHRLEFLHSLGIVHGDVKPHNFAIGYKEHKNIVHMIDLGHAKMYLDPKTGTHIPFREERAATGTIRYASVAAHSRHEVSRRDDLESFLYVLLEFYYGTLPWRGILAPNWKAKVERTVSMKSGNVLPDLLAQSPPEFGAFHQHCASLSYGQAPDYDFLRTLFSTRLKVEGWTCDWQFDWLDPSGLLGGTLIPEEYVVDIDLVEEREWNPEYM